MDDFAELALEGAMTGVDHFDKVYDPLKDRAKRMPNPIKKVRGESNQHQDQDQYDEYDSPRRSNTDRDQRGSTRDRDVRLGEADEYDTIRRSNTDGGRRGLTQDVRGGQDDEYDSIRRSNTDRRGPRRDRVRDEYVETYERRSTRAKSAGRDGYNGSGGRGLHRDDRRKSHRKKYYSDSESSTSQSPHRRKSLGEKALVALGLGGVGAVAEKEFDEHRRDRYQSTPRRRHRDSDRTYDRPREFKRDDRPRRAETFSDDYSQSSKMPAGYLGSNVPERDLRVATRNDKNAPQSVVTRRPNADTSRDSKRSSSSSSSSDTSSLCSSSEDERRTRKMKGKEFLTAGLAAVATIHAVHGVVSSYEARNKRHIEVAKGEMAPKEARRLKNKARVQDAAAIGIAALGIKSAYGEWQEVQESRHELGSQKEERMKRHEKRVRRAEKEARKQREQREGRYRDDRDRHGGRDGYRSA